MKIIAYLRVSTGGQELSNQRLAILNYAQHHQLQIERFLEIQVSSRKSLKERGIEGLFEGMQAGDLLLVSELSRLGRSVGQIIQIVDDLIKHKIKLIAIRLKTRNQLLVHIEAHGRFGLDMQENSVI
jgi:DNA invertase Pin-like site-specific DNA recombinase